MAPLAGLADAVEDIFTQQGGQADRVVAGECYAQVVAINPFVQSVTGQLDHGMRGSIAAHAASLDECSMPSRSVSTRSASARLAGR